MPLLDQVALGIYIGLLTGMFTALLVFGLAFVFQYVANVAFPATMGLMIGLGSAGLQGGLFRLMRDPAALRSPVIIVALLLTLLITHYSQKRGQDLAKQIPPKSVLFGSIRRRTLSPEVVKQLGRFGQIRVSVTGEVMDMEGYPPLPEEIRTAISANEWTFPGDLPITELEKRLVERLKAEHALDDAAVAIDERGNATISAAPPSSGLSRRVPADKHATTLEAIVPTGAAFGDKVELAVGGPVGSGAVGGEAGDESIDGSVVSVNPPEAKKEEKSEDGEKETPTPVAQTAAGGKERVAVAVDPSSVSQAISGEVSKFVVRPRGQNREYELVSLLRKQGNAFRKLVVGADGAFVGKQLSELDLRANHGVDVLAIKSADGWAFAPRGTAYVEAGDELFVTGPDEAIEGVREVSA